MVCVRDLTETRSFKSEYGLPKNRVHPVKICWYARSEHPLLFAKKNPGPLPGRLQCQGTSKVTAVTWPGGKQKPT